MARLKLNENQLLARRPQLGQLLTLPGAEELGPLLEPRHANLSIRYAVRRAEAVIGLFKTESIKHFGPRKAKGHFEWKTMNWVYRYNNDKLHGMIEHLTPNEMENALRQQKNRLGIQHRC